MNDTHEDILRRVLGAEAEQVRPAGDGLDIIRERIEQRRRRLRWLRPTFAVATAAALGAAAAIAVALTQSSKQTLQPPVGRSPAPTHAPSTPPSPQASTPPTPNASTSAAPAPATGQQFLIYPFTSVAEIRSWQAAGGPVKQPWALRPDTVALSFAQFLGINGVSVASVVDEPGGKYVILQASNPNGQPHTVSQVHLIQPVTGPDGPWIVKRAGAYNLKVTSPQVYATGLRSPVTVSGSSPGVDVGLQVAVYARGGLLGPVTHATVGELPWTVQVSFAPTGNRYVVIVARTDTGYGGIGQFVAVPVMPAAAGG